MFWTQAFQRLRLCRLYVRKEGDFMPVYGYARVSTDGQTLRAQIAQLRAAGAEKVFQEKVGGARRPSAACASHATSRDAPSRGSGVMSDRAKVIMTRAPYADVR